MSDWKTIKIRASDHELIMTLRQHLLAHGSQHLPTAARQQLESGASLGAIVGAGLAMLSAAAAPPAPPPRRR